MTDKGKRRQRWVIAILLVVFSVGSTVYIAARNPYQFLYDFNPDQMIARGQHTGKLATVLIFGPKESPGVIKALKEHLTKEAGFNVEQPGSSGYGTQWQFSRGNDFVEFNSQAAVEGATAIVVIEHEPNWAENLMAKLHRLFGPADKR